MDDIPGPDVVWVRLGNVRYGRMSSTMAGPMRSDDPLRLSLVLAFAAVATERRLAAGSLRAKYGGSVTLGGA